MAITINEIDGFPPVGNEFTVWGLGPWHVYGTIDKPEGDVVLTMEFIAAINGHQITVPPAAQQEEYTDPADYDFDIPEGEFTVDGRIYPLAVSASTRENVDMDAPPTTIRWSANQQPNPPIIAQAAPRRKV